MRFSTTLSVALLAFAKLIAADSEQFGLLTIRSGSALQYSSVVNKDGTLYFGSSNGLSGVVTDAGKLKLGNQYAVANDDGSVTLTDDEAKASSGFAISNGNLQYKDGSFYGVPEGSEYKFTTKSEGDDSLGVAISARSASSGQTVPDFAPGDASKTDEKSTSTVAPPAVSQVGDGQVQADTKTEADKTPAQTPAPTAAAVSQIGDGQVQATTGTQSVWVKTESGNAAGKVSLGAGAGIAAVAALLL